MIYKNVDLHNFVEQIETAPGDFVFSRLPEELRPKLNPGVQGWAIGAGGCEVRFNIVGEEARVRLRMVGGPDKPEVFQGSIECTRTYVPQDDGENTIKITLPRPDASRLKDLPRPGQKSFDPLLTRIVLPIELQLRGIEIEGDVAPPGNGQTPEKKLLCYGSSITQGFSAARPSGTYAMRTAEHLGMDLINLGFAGSAHLEAELADYIAERPDWDVCSLELGINVIGMWSIEEFAAKVDYFVERIAASNPDRWLFVMDLFTFDMDFRGDPKAEAYRGIVRDKVASLDLPKTVYVDGREMLTSIGGLTIDLVHPSPAGMEDIARNLAALIASRV